MMKQFSTGMLQQVISVTTGMATLLTALIWVAFGALVPEVGHAHIETVDSVRASGIVTAAMEDEVAAWMDLHEQDEEGFHRATRWYIPMMTAGFSFTPNRIALEAGKRYYIKLATRDVNHGIRFQLPDGGSRTWTIMPGGGAALLITFDEPGYYTAVCDVYCGVGHHEMTVTFKVVESL